MSPAVRLRPMAASSENAARRAALKIKNKAQVIVDQVKMIKTTLESNLENKIQSIQGSLDIILIDLDRDISAPGVNDNPDLRGSGQRLLELTNQIRGNINDFIADPNQRLGELFRRANILQVNAFKHSWEDSKVTTHPIYRRATEQEIAPEDMGVSHIIYPRLGRAAAVTNSVIFIRKTSKGSVLPFEQATAVGKKLPTKGKSSNSYFTAGTIPFFASLSKKVENWCKEQNNLVEITTSTKRDGVTPKYGYISKLIELESDKIKKEGQFLNGVTEQTNGDLVVEIEDSLEGNETKITTYYYLKKVRFNQVNRLNGQPISKPSFIRNDTDECYQVYIAKKSIYTSKAFNAIIDKFFMEEVDGDEGKVRRKTTLGNTLTYNSELSFEGREPNSNDLRDLTGDYVSYLWEHYWYVKMSPDGGTNSPLTRFAPPEEFTIGGIQEPYYPVNVLALYTRGKMSDLNKVDQTEREQAARDNNLKQYFEIVADYDVFMIAPNVESIINQMTIEGGEMSIDERFFRRYTEDESLAPYMQRYIPQADRDRARHGITSNFEKIEVRRAINVNMGINSVQHGTEIANVFHISDIQEPVMMFRPGANDLTKDLFFLDLKLLFKICNPNQTNQIFPSYRPGKPKGVLFDPNYNVDIFIPEGQNIASDFILLFNLNWGTEYYFRKTMPTDCTTVEQKEAYIENQDEYFKAIIREIETHVLGNTQTQFNELFESYLGAPIPVKAFSLFLYQNYRLLAGTRRFIRSGTQVEVQRPPELRFITKLLFWGYYYNAIYNENVRFAPLVGIGTEDIAEVKYNYGYALRVIMHIVDRILNEKNETTGGSPTLRGRRLSGTGLRNLYLIGALNRLKNIINTSIPTPEIGVQEP